MTTYTSILNPKINLRDPGHLQFFFEQYKLFVDSYNKLSERRKDLNTFYVTVNTLIISILGALGEGKFFLQKTGALLSILTLLGIVIAFAWISAIHVYKIINNKNYATIVEFEQYFPALLYTSLNKDLERLDPHAEGKNFIVQREIIVPYAFLSAYLLYLMFNIYRLYLG